MAWITPTSVHRSNGPRKYDIPVCSVSLSSRFSWRARAACENSVAEICRRIWGFVVLQGNQTQFSSQGRKHITGVRRRRSPRYCCQRLPCTKWQMRICVLGLNHPADKPSKCIGEVLCGTPFRLWWLAMRSWQRVSRNNHIPMTENIPGI